MLSITVEISRRITEQFKKAAKLAFPKETFAYLIGHDAGTQLAVEELYFPDDVEQHCTEDAVHVQPHWLVDAQTHARETAAEVIGDIHSHPFPHSMSYVDRSPSESDIDRAWGSVYGICLVRQDKNGRLRASIRFYPRQPEMITKVV